MTQRIVLVRHALSAADPAVDSKQWGLAEGAADEARRLAHMLPDDIGNTIWTSAETKAVDTARAIADERGLDVAIDDRFGEVTRPWTGDDYRAIAIRYLSGGSVHGWEDQRDVVARFTAGVSEVASGGTAVIVNHGLAMSLYVHSVTSIDQTSFWDALTFPDAWLLDGEQVSRAYDDPIDQT